MNSSNRNGLWAEIFVDELSRAGLTRVCISPGSRSTPLTLAFAKHPRLRTYVIVDERSCAYFALGLGLALEEPVAVLCTSGGATANLYPGIIEAERSNIPLIIMTADRPPELRDSMANQTIDQIRMFGGHVKWSLDVPVPENQPSEIMLRYLRTVCDRTLALSQLPPSGPVHLNFPFRKPLIPPLPDAPPDVISPHESLANRARSVGSPQTTISHGTFLPSDDDIQDLAVLIRQHPRGLIVLGPRANAAKFAGALAQFARLAGYPILADPLSGARFSGLVDQDILICGGYTTFLPSLTERNRGRCQVVLHIGAPPISGSLEQFILSQLDCIHIGIALPGLWNDPSHLLSRLIWSDPVQTIGLLSEAMSDLSTTSTSKLDWEKDFGRLERAAWHAIGLALADPEYEGAMVSDLVSGLGEGEILFSASSLPIRHLDQFARPTGKTLQIFANRGASGIDGTLSTSAGVSAGMGRPVTILIGDLAFHHDQTGLLALSKFGKGSTVVLINNGGGGIFRRLPISDFEAPFKEYFQTPTGINFEALALGFGGTHVRVQNRDQFRQEFSKKTSSDSFRVIEYQSDIGLDSVVIKEVEQNFKEVIKNVQLG